MPRRKETSFRACTRKDVSFWIDRANAREFESGPWHWRRNWDIITATPIRRMRFGAIDGTMKKSMHNIVFDMGNVLTKYSLADYIWNLDILRKRVPKAGEGGISGFFESMSVSPEDCFFEDDSPANIEAGMRFGMKGCVYHQNMKELRTNLRMAGFEVNV